jgi:hypothetical protein
MHEAERAPQPESLEAMMEAMLARDAAAPLRPDQGTAPDLPEENRFDLRYRRAVDYPYWRPERFARVFREERPGPRKQEALKHVVRLLRVGMTKGEVEKLLGPPSSVPDHLGNSMTFDVCPSSSYLLVQFDSDDRLRGWVSYLTDLSRIWPDVLAQPERLPVSEDDRVEAIRHLLRVYGVAEVLTWLETAHCRLSAEWKEKVRRVAEQEATFLGSSD